MAIKKYKECGDKISTRAKSCPSCREQTTKKTSAFTWLVLIGIIAYAANGVFYDLPDASNQALTSDASPEEAPQFKPKIKPKPLPKWDISTSTDTMTGQIRAYASSPLVRPNSPMDFPYTDARGNMGIGCDRESEWAYFVFTMTPNLDDTRNSDGHNILQARVRWDDVIQEVDLSQKWGSEVLHFSDNADAIERIARADSVLLELHWYGEGRVYFDFTLRGSSAAIEEIRQICNQQFSNRRTS